MSDSYFHIITPPGSSKTILVLEIAIRINKSTLILAPTVNCNQQSVDTKILSTFFLQNDLNTNWISRDIRNEKFMTVVTYKGLQSACNNIRSKEEQTDEEDTSEENLDNSTTNPNLYNIVKKLKSINIKTIANDTANHLKNEWWKTLNK